MPLRKGDWKATTKRSLGALQSDRDIQRHNVASGSLVETAQNAHEPVRPGKMITRELIDKDRRQSPHHLGKGKSKTAK